MGGVMLGQLAGWLLDHGFSYTPVLIVAASLHVIAFAFFVSLFPISDRSFSTPGSDS